MNRQNSLNFVFTAIIAYAGMQAALPAHAAIVMDRTRVVFNGEDKSLTINISNNNQELPYLAQAWVEDEEGNKIEGPLTALPPLQRVEPGAKSQVKIQATAAAAQLAQDKETLFYFNLREIPPKSTKPNTLQIALQTRIKLFYRPKALKSSGSRANPWQEKLTLTRQGEHYVAHNPTPYYVTLASAAPGPQGNAISGFSPVMLPPGGSATLGVSASALGRAPVLTYINDYGGRPKLVFQCDGANCVVSNSEQR